LHWFLFQLYWFLSAFDYYYCTDYFFKCTDSLMHSVIINALIYIKIVSDSWMLLRTISVQIAFWVYWFLNAFNYYNCTDCSFKCIDYLMHLFIIIVLMTIKRVCWFLNAFNYSNCADSYLKCVDSGLHLIILIAPIPT